MADVILIALVIGLVVYKLQDVCGRAYDRRTEQLRITRERYFLTARILIENPNLDEMHLVMTSKINQMITHPSAARAMAFGLRMAIQGKENRERAGTKVEASADENISVMIDFVSMSDAAMLYIAERSLLWGPYIRRLMRVLFKENQGDPRRSAVVIEGMIGGGLAHPA